MTMTGHPGHLRKRSSLDPFSDPEIYYGDGGSLRREIKERRRAFSSVGAEDCGRTSSSPSQTDRLKCPIESQVVQPRGHPKLLGKNAGTER